MRILAALLLFLLCAPAYAAEAPSAASAADLVANAAPVTLPADVVWETNNDEPLIGSPKAIRGGRYNVGLGAYPLTFRIMGPNNNDYFAAWNRAFASGFSLVMQHPTTDKFIPIMATHWSVQADKQTIYFKLDPDARFSDGHKITADDYVFTWRMMQSRFIVDPFYNTYAEQYFKSVDKIDDYTLRIVGTRESWRPLYDYAGLWPTPRHVTQLDKDWVTRTTNQPQVVAGPYVVSDTVRGESVTFKRVPNWWGDKKRYFQGMYNFDEIHIRVITPDRELDYVRQGELDTMIESSSRAWNENYTFPAITNGWLRRERVFLESPSGIYGIHLNLEAPIFQNKDFRTGLQYLFNFERLNRNLMYNEYFRLKSFFEGTEYADPDLKARTFDPVKAQELFAKAGFHRPREVGDLSFFGKIKAAVTGLIFTRSDTDDILVNDKGEKASFTLIYGGKTVERHLTVMQQDFRRAGIDLRLQLLEDGTTFERALERKFEMTMLAMTSGIYPEPRQYLHTDFKKTNNNNDFWGFGTPEVDALIKTYEESQDADERREALRRIDRIVYDEAMYIPFWTAPYMRLVHWDYIQFPDFYLPRRTQQLPDFQVYWFDPEKKKALEEAMRTNTPYKVDPELDKDPYDVKKKFQ